MGADPIALCGNCREVKSIFNLNACVYCINDYFATNIDEKSGRVITGENLAYSPDKKDFIPGCLIDKPCEELERIAKCVRNGHRLLVDPCR
ncbi:hypothetical protein ACFVS2_25965 [Brevibacillus sp. NPDC058079]|uniref:hypothetical protein n=1 Tax=Brevibacillus sp. NPDC058079 TaxID=3346330 RepID=UPI0036E7A429